MRRDLLGALRGLEERRQRVEVFRAFVRELGHRTPLRYTRGAFQVGDLEGDALAFGALGGQIGRTEVAVANAEIGMTVEAADDGKELRSGKGLLVAREALFLRPR